MGSIRKRGKSYQAQARLSGGRSASATFQTKAAAQTWLREKTYELHKQPKNIDERISLAELILRFQQETAPMRPSGNTEALRLNNLLRHPISSKPIAGVKTSDLADYRDMRLKHVATNTLVRELGVARCVVRTAIEDWGHNVPNPFESFRLKRRPDQRFRRLHDDELLHLLATPSRSIYTKDVACFALETAMRLGEILALSWKDIDWEKGLITVRTSKNGHGRIVPITPKAHDILVKQVRISSAVFPVKIETLKLSWRRLVRRAGLTDLRFHDLRHEAISRLLEKGLTLPEAASVSGHRTASMLLRYAHPDPQKLKEKMLMN